MSTIAITVPASPAHSMHMHHYHILKASLLACTKVAVFISFADLLKAVAVDLKRNRHNISGKLGWHLAWVALDLEKAHQLCHRTTGKKQGYSLPLALSNRSE